MGYTTSTVHGIDVPNSAEANNVPEDLGKIVDVLETGSLVKRLTSTEIGNLTNAQKPAGLVVYNTTTNKLQISDGSAFANIDAALLPLAGGTMTGNIAMGTNKVTGLGNGTASTDAATKGQIDAAMPIGSLVAYAGSSAPTDWLLCYGQAVSRTTYASLFTVLGTTYGVGNGSTTFNLPDLRGRVAAGVDNMGGSAASRITSATSGITGTTLGAAGGDQRLHAHSHGITDPGHTHPFDVGNTGSTTGASGSFTTNATTPTLSATTGITINNNTQGGTAQNVQPTMMLNYIIRAA